MKKNIFLFFQRFPTFLAVLESKYSGGGSLDAAALTEAIDDLYQTYVEDVLKKVRISIKNIFKIFSIQLQ